LPLYEINDITSLGEESMAAIKAMPFEIRRGKIIVKGEDISSNILGARGDIKEPDRTRRQRKKSGTEC